MIGRSNRFHGRGNIQRLQRSGKSVRFSAFALRYLSNPRSGSYRLAVVVSRKVSKSAVVRNRIRRRVYECVRILSNDLIAPADLVIVVYDERIAEVSPDKLRADIARLLKKARLTSAESDQRAIVESKD